MAGPAAHRKIPLTHAAAKPPAAIWRVGPSPLAAELFALVTGADANGEAVLVGLPGAGLRAVAKRLRRAEWPREFPATG
jgi:hypothetical protein